jgi:D-glycero-alpha-D-manno-heptose 1-phosphate guanylyltransferase
MEAVILAGGFGTRLREVVPDLPKPMAPVAGKPFLEILLNSLKQKGFTRIILSLGYMADKVVSYFGYSHNGIDLVYEIEETPLGTGGALKAALRHCNSDHVFIFNGDTFLDLETDEVEAKWQGNNQPMIIAREVEDTSRYGRLDTNEGYVTGFIEKGISGPGLINAGCYILPKKVFEDFNSGDAFSLEQDYLFDAVQNQPFKVFATQGHFIDIGIPQDYSRAQTELLEYT